MTLSAKACSDGVRGCTHFTHQPGYSTTPGGRISPSSTRLMVSMGSPAFRSSQYSFSRFMFIFLCFRGVDLRAAGHVGRVGCGPCWGDQLKFDVIPGSDGNRNG